MDNFKNLMQCGELCQNKIKLFDNIGSAIFMILAILISTIYACRHLKNYSNAYFQDKIIGIILL